MRNRYFFDKRDLRHFFLKYGIMLAIAIPLVIVANYLMYRHNPNQRFILVDLAIIAVVVAIGELICYLIKKAKQTKEEE